MRTTSPRARARSALTALALAAAALLAPAPASSGDPAQVEQGRKIFKDEGCPQCHGFGGKGDGYLLGMLKEPVKMHDWTDAATVQGWTDEYLFEITRQGGEAIGKNKVMLKYGNKLTDEQIRTVVVYARSVMPKPNP